MTHRLNVSGVSIGGPFALTSLVDGFDWTYLPNGTLLDEAITFLAPSAPRTYPLSITVSYVPVAS